MDAIKAAGFNSIRFTCELGSQSVNRINYIIKHKWLERIKEVVDYVLIN